MADRIEALKELAQQADEGYSGAHPRDSNNWQANEAFCRACDPSTILKLVAVVEAARRAEPVLMLLAHKNAAALKSALTALDEREPA